VGGRLTKASRVADDQAMLHVASIETEGATESRTVA